MYYEDVFKELKKGEIRYLAIGGVAVNLYGFTRTTLDLDLIISLDAANREKFLSVMKKLRFKIHKPALAEKLMLGKYAPGKIKVLTFYRDEFELIDVFIQETLDFEKAYKNKKTFKSGKTSIDAVPYDMLLSMKRETGREKDLLDIGHLEKIKEMKNNEK